MADLNQFQPLYPEDRVLAPLLEQAAEFVAECHRLDGRLVSRSSERYGPGYEQ